MIRKIDWANDALPDGRPLLRVAQELEAAHGAKVAAQQLSALMGRPSFDDRQLCGILRKHGRLPRVSPFGAAAIPDSRISPVAVCAPPSTTPAAPSPLPAQAERGRGAFPCAGNSPGRETEPRVAERAPAVVVQPVLSDFEGLVAYVADIHAGSHSEAAFGAFEAWGLEARPDIVVLLGDLGERASGSQHPGTVPRHYLEDEADEAGVVRRILRFARRVILKRGNHDNRAERKIATATQGTMAGCYDSTRHLRELGVEVFGGPQALRIGSVKGLHGHEFMNPRSPPPQYHTRKALARYGEAGCVVVYGHVHCEQRIRLPMDRGVQAAISLPSLCEPQPAWVGDELTGWEQGFAVQNVRRGKRDVFQVVPIIDGECYWGGRLIAA